MDEKQALKILGTIREDIEMLKEAIDLGSESEQKSALQRVLGWVPKLSGDVAQPIEIDELS